MSETTHKGILKEFNPSLDQNGNHNTWNSGQGKLMYDFNSTFERNDGTEPKEDKGTMASTSDSPKWKVGGEYTYTRKIQGASGQFIKFSGVKSTDAPAAGGYGGGGGGGYKKLTREDKDRIIRSVALEVAHNALIDLNKTDVVEYFKTLTATANVFGKFVEQHAGGVKEKEMMLENAIRRSVDGLQFKNYFTGMKVKDDKGNLTTEDKRGMDSAAELTAYAWNCFSYIWAGTKEDGNVMTPDELQQWEQSKT